MKQVKFNLYVDQQKIRTIDELKEHFNIDDLLEWYEQGVLQKWLSVRCYTEELAKVEAINHKNVLQIASEIISIFNFTESQAKAALDSLNYRLNYAKESNTSELSKQEFMEDYFKRYNEIKQILLERVD